MLQISIWYTLKNSKLIMGDQCPWPGLMVSVSRVYVYVCIYTCIKFNVTKSARVNIQLCTYRQAVTRPGQIGLNDKRGIHPATKSALSALLIFSILLYNC